MGKKHHKRNHKRRSDPDPSSSPLVPVEAAHLHAVTSRAAMYLQRWCEHEWANDVTGARARMRDFSRMLLAVGRGRACIPTCEHTLRHARTMAYTSMSRMMGQSFDLSAVVVRALSFVGLSELRALRVQDADVFRLVLSMMQPPSPNGTPNPVKAQALDSLQAVEVVALREDEESGQHAAAVIERCAATVTELQGSLPARLLCASDGEGRPPILARCTRLEVLEPANRYTSTLWLGLSQLHTLRSVHLDVVSVAAMAAALPRLHTLTASGSTDPAMVARFFTDLLPRLRVFHFSGVWSAAPEPTAGQAAPLPLPLLEELVWNEFLRRPEAFRGFLGAQPRLLHVACEIIAECLPGRGGVDTAPTIDLLARACELRISFGAAIVDVFDLAQVLRVAPELRKLCLSHNLRGDPSWLTNSTVPIHPTFSDLVHRRVRYSQLQKLCRLTMPARRACARLVFHDCKRCRSTIGQSSSHPMQRDSMPERHYLQSGALLPCFSRRGGRTRATGAPQLQSSSLRASPYASSRPPCALRPVGSPCIAASVAFCRRRRR